MTNSATRALAGGNHKSTGIDWLGSIPACWEVGNLRRFAQMKTGHTPSRNETSYWDNCNIPWFGLADVWQLRDGTRKYLGKTKENISEIGLANSAAELLPAGTVILSRTASVGFTGIMPVQMATTQDFWNWICGPKLLPDYLYWLFRAMGPKIEQTTNGSTHKTIYQGDAASFEICVPPLETQHRIARFLDDKAARINRLIGKKRALLDRLAEKRQALITRTVTKGLNPAAPMKPSGIDWLGISRRIGRYCPSKGWRNSKAGTHLTRRSVHTGKIAKYLGCRSTTRQSCGQQIIFQIRLSRSMSWGWQTRQRGFSLRGR